MVQQGLVIREPDRDDGRPIFTTLAPGTSARRYFAAVIEAE
jgi:hypothetical protein